MTKKNVKRLMDALVEHARNIENSIHASCFKDWRIGDSESHVPEDLLDKLDEKDVNTTFQVSYSSMGELYYAVIHSLELAHNEYTVTRCKLDEVNKELESLKCAQTKANKKSTPKRSIGVQNAQLRKRAKISRPKSDSAVKNRLNVKQLPTTPGPISENIESDSASPRKSSRLAGKSRRDYKVFSEETGEDNGKQTKEEVPTSHVVPATQFVTRGKRTKFPVVISSPAPIRPATQFSPTPQTEAADLHQSPVVPDAAASTLTQNNEELSDLDTQTETLDHEYGSRAVTTEDQAALDSGGATTLNQVVEHIPGVVLEQVQLTEVQEMDETGDHVAEVAGDHMTGVTEDHVTGVAGDHVTILHPESELRFQCDVCQELFSSAAGFKRHRRRSHQVALADSQSGNTREAAVAETSGSPTCKVCGKRCKSLSEMRRHMVTHCKTGTVYSCVLCKSIFHQALDFERHIRVEHHDTGYQDLPSESQTKFQCAACETQHESVIDLILHTKDKHRELLENPAQDDESFAVARKRRSLVGPSSFTCEKCNKTFQRSNDLARHMLRHDATIRTESGGYNCAHCSVTFSNFVKYQKHPCIRQNPARRPSGKAITSALHGENKCPKCEKKIPGVTALPIHIITHYKTLSGYVCKSCHKSYKSATVFYNHLKTEHDLSEFEPDEWLESEPSGAVIENVATPVKPSQPGKCGQCGKICPTFFSLKRHIRAMHGNKAQGTFDCKLCPAVYKEKKNLILHTRARHSGEKPYKCHHCDAAFIGKRHLLRHVMSHTGERPFACEECGKTFIERADVVKHVRTRHMPTVKDKMCEVCGKGFRTAAQLKIHVRSHTGDKPYKCEFCPAAFNQLGPLKYHTSIHTGNKPFVCEICRKAFPTHSSAKQHVMRCANKSTAATYQCELCAKRFKRAENLQRHLASHHQRPVEIVMYACDLCEEKFVLEKTLLEHRMSAHPPPPADQVTDLQETILLSDIRNADGEIVTVYITQ